MAGRPWIAQPIRADIDAPRLESRYEVGCPGGRAMFIGPNHRRDRRSLEPSDLAGMLPANPAVRGISVRARNHAPSARGTAEEAGPARRLAPHSVPGVAQTPRIHSHPERPRSVSGHDGTGPLG